jgi:hypothetical protein
VGLLEHRHNLKEASLEKLKLTLHAYAGSHTVGWDEARILEIESVENTRNRPIWHA